MREKVSGAPVRRRALTALAVAVLAQLSGPDGAPSAAAGDAQIPVDETVITLLHTNDVHGSILYPDEPRGIAKIATLARRIRQQMPYVFLLDGGDIIHGTPAEKVFEGQPVIAAMNAAGYDAAAAGNHEFDFGHRIALGAFAAAEFPMLSANVVDAASGEPSVGLQPFIIREVDGVRIAIFGLTTDRTPEIQWPRTIEGIEFRDAVDTGRALVPRLRDDEGADLIVALTHIGLDADRELAEAVPGIDIILGGHSHTRVDEQVWVGTTLVAQAGSAARDLGRVDVHLRREGDGAAVVAINGQDGRWWGQGDVPAPLGKDYPHEPLIPLSASIADDPAVAAAYRPYGDSIRAYLEEELTNAAEPLPAEGAGRGDRAGEPAGGRRPLAYGCGHRTERAL